MSHSAAREAGPGAAALTPGAVLQRATGALARARGKASSRRGAVFAIRPLAAAARTDQGKKHRSPTRNTPQPRAFSGTDAEEFPILGFELPIPLRPQRGQRKLAWHCHAQ